MKYSLQLSVLCMYTVGSMMLCILNQPYFCNVVIHVYISFFQFINGLITINFKDSKTVKIVLTYKQVFSMSQYS